MGYCSEVAPTRGTVFRIAHISDLHVLSPRGVEWRRILFNKRITGYANLLLHRARVYRREYLLAVLAAAAAAADHVAVTGDVTNLSLEREFEEARALLDGVARTVEVTVVPGNHDVYLPSVHAARRFAHHFAAFLRSDLPELAREMETGRFPCVKLRGPAAIIALSSAVPRPPFVASDGLVDADRLRAALAPLARGLVLFGHLHVRVRRPLPTAAGGLDAISASGAALDAPDPAVRAGFNLYALADDGRVVAAEAHVLAPDGRALCRIPLLGGRKVA